MLKNVSTYYLLYLSLSVIYINPLSSLYAMLQNQGLNTTHHLSYIMNLHFPSGLTMVLFNPFTIYIPPVGLCCGYIIMQNIWYDRRKKVSISLDQALQVSGGSPRVKIIAACMRGQTKWLENFYNGSSKIVWKISICPFIKKKFTTTLHLKPFRNVY